MKTILLMFFLCFLSVLPLSAQVSFPDSMYQDFKHLKKQPQTFKRDSLMISLLFELCQSIDFNGGPLWNDSLRIYTNKLNSPTGRRIRQISTGDSLNSYGKFKEGTAQLLKVAKESEALKDYAHAAFAYLRLGAVAFYMHQSDISIKDPMEYYSKASELAKKSKLPEIIVQAMGYIADYDLEKKKYKKVIKDQLEAQRIIMSKFPYRALRHLWSVYYALGTSYLNLNLEKRALLNYERALYWARNPAKKPYLEYTIHDNLARYYFERKKYDLSLKELDKSYEALVRWRGKRKLVDSENYLNNIYLTRYTIYKIQKDYQKALTYFELFNKSREEKVKSELEKQYNELHEKYDSEQNKMRIASLTNEALLKENEKQQSVRNFLILIIVLSFSLLLIVLSYNKSRRRNTSLKLNLSIIQKELTEKVLQTQEIERQRIASDLHDDLGGTIATIKRRLAELKEKDNQKEIKNIIEEIEPMIQQTGEDIRRISHNLMPPDFNRIELISSIEYLVNRTTNKDTHIEFLTFGKVHDFNSDVSVNIYRIVTELINNILKHAQATHATAQFIYYAEYLLIVVEDNGIGYEMVKANESGIGLKNIFLRSAYIGAKLETDSGNNGSVFVLEIPYTIKL